MTSDSDTPILSTPTDYSKTTNRLVERLASRIATDILKHDQRVIDLQTAAGHDIPTDKVHDNNTVMHLVAGTLKEESKRAKTQALDLLAQGLKKGDTMLPGVGKPGTLVSFDAWVDGSAQSIIALAKPKTPPAELPDAAQIKHLLRAALHSYIDQHRNHGAVSERAL